VFAERSAGGAIGSVREPNSIRKLRQRTDRPHAGDLAKDFGFAGRHAALATAVQGNGSKGSFSSWPRAPRAYGGLIWDWRNIFCTTSHFICA
jgi:hypothetical protein